MERHENGGSNPKDRDELFESQEEEFGPEAFEDEEEELEDQSREATANDQAQVKQAKLPWILFAVSVAAIIALVIIGKPWSAQSDTVATVNGEKISKEELYQAMYSQSGEASLDSLITDAIINQEATKKNITVTDQEINTELENTKKQFPDDEQFNAALKQYGMTLEKLKDSIATTIKATKLYETTMDVSEAKQKEYFDSHKDKYGTPEEREVSHILVDKKEDAEKLLAELKGGADFAELAKQNSQDPGSKDKGGSLGFVSKGQGLDPAFEEAAFKLEKGGLSGVVESQFGYHIIKVTDIKQAVAANFEEKKDQVRKDMVQEDMQNNGSAWMDKLKQAAKIEKSV